MDRPLLVIGAITLIILGGIIGISVYGQSNFEPRKTCVEHSLALSMHIHPKVSILIDGQPITIPANIGILPTCMQAIHTHDESGELHVEYPQQHDFKLADFFANWGQPFSKQQVLDKSLDEHSSLIMTVDGQPSEEFENLILRDQQQIVIELKTLPQP